MTVWHEVEDALEAIIDDYIRVNHLISLFQDDKARHTGLKKAGHQTGTALELGSGPGNFTEMLRPLVDGQIVCLDYSAKMITHARKGEHRNRTHHIQAIFERLPVRTCSITITCAAYALRDSTDKTRTYSEIGKTLKPGGRLLVIDIGKPDNPIIRGVFSMYMRYIVPIIAGLATKQGHRNPWSILYKTYQLLPPNKDLQHLIENTIGPIEITEPSLGGLIIALADKTY
jgi:demethylmenaquinone methyltransferase/2-methoxy-6-polyprenyl-1,4-benzoquinol methylase